MAIVSKEIEGLRMHEVRQPVRRAFPPVTARGFSLVELVVTVAVLAVLAGVAVPSFQAMMHRNRLTAAANEMVATLQLAKLEAVRRNSRNLVVCPTTTGTACATGDNWSRVLVFDDTNSNGTADTDGLEVVVRDVQVIRPGVGITAAMGSTDRFRFSSDGRARVGSSVASASISLTSGKLPAADATRRVQIAAGRISVCNPFGTPPCS